MNDQGKIWSLWGDLLCPKSPLFEVVLKKEDNLKKEDDLKNEDNLENEEDLRNEEILKILEDVMLKTLPGPSLYAHSRW